VGASAQGGAFRLEEATIAEVHRAIQQAQITCRDLVRAYVDRARAYNGVSIQTLAAERQFRLHVAQYLERRAADWKARGFTETLVDWPRLNARSKFWSDEQRAMWKNWEEVDNLLAPIDERQGVAERLMLRELLRRVEMKVIQENRLDVVVRLHTSLPPGKIGLAPWPGPAGDTRGDLRMGPYAGETEVLIPAGYVRTVYDARFVLSPDRRRYIAQNSDTPTTVAEPGLPFSLVFRAEPGAEDRILKVASAYEAASKAVCHLRRIRRCGIVRSATARLPAGSW
jgi:amidase